MSTHGYTREAVRILSGGDPVTSSRRQLRRFRVRPRAVQARGRGLASASGGRRREARS